MPAISTFSAAFALIVGTKRKGAAILRPPPPLIPDFRLLSYSPGSPVPVRGTIASSGSTKYSMSRSSSSSSSLGCGSGGGSPAGIRTWR
jgi:hypothetical protein